MSRLAIPASIDAAPAAARPLLQAVHQQIGSVPNLFRLVAQSPAALEGYLGMSGALAKGSLPAPTRERIALAAAQLNDCGYCLSAHSYMGQHLAKLELRVMFEQLLPRLESIEVQGPGSVTHTNFVGGLKHLPATVTVS